MCFTKSDVRLGVLEKLDAWNRNAKLPPAQRPNPPRHHYEQKLALTFPNTCSGLNAVKLLGKMLEAVRVDGEKVDTPPLLVKQQHMFRKYCSTQFRTPLLDVKRILVSDLLVCHILDHTVRSWMRWDSKVKGARNP